MRTVDKKEEDVTDKKEDVLKGDRILNLSLFNQPSLLRNLLAVFAISLVMTWVEIVILQFLVIPNVNSTIVNKVRLAGAKEHNNNQRNESDLYSTIVNSAFYKSMETDTNAALFALEKDEARQIRTSNIFVSLITFVPWLLLCFLVYLLYQRLKNDVTRLKRLEDEGFVEIFGSEMKATIILTIIGVVVFVAFQYCFYKIGEEWSNEDIEDLTFESNLSIEKRLCVQNKTDSSTPSR
jgi:hypothetical protein